MTAIAYKSIDNGTFTDAILDANFQVIGDYTQHLDRYLTVLGQQVVALTEAHEKLAKKVAKLPKKRHVLPFVVGAGVGVYVYKRLRKSGMNVKFDSESGSLKVDNVKDAAQKAYAETVRKDVPQTQDESFEG